MNISVFLEEETLGEALSSSLMSITLFCEAHGYNTRWEVSDRKLYITPGRMLESIIFQTLPADSSNTELVEELRNYLEAEGFITFTNGNQEARDKPHIMLEMIEEEHRTIPQLSLEHPSHLDERVKNALLSELNKRSIPFQFRELKYIKANSPVRLKLVCKLPKKDSAGRNLASILTRAIVCYSSFSQKGPKQSGFFLPLPVMKTLVKGFLLPKSGTEHKQAAEKSSVQPVPAPLNVRQVETKADAEIAMNYTLLLPRSGEAAKEVMINGALLMKNIGNSSLIDPVICIKIPVEKGISLQGQILPPKMVEGLAVKGSSGDKGWKYVYDNWRERVKTKGEYWISSIHQLEILPGETSIFNGLNLSIKDPEEDSSVLIQAFVYFNEGKHRFASSNSISLSF
ncbi:hypothetical protein [Bacillus infantis]|uniref:hypothetical protein n=1 Tax=Bacillus infantis TaxID=324767 RepID=UPI000B9A1D38|nr:hypothetical protein [Bacillus infantis]MCK6206917.1 hypothetical protein [Bacillus infantis]OXT14668.1 hypothetical protein B9K06_25155 [Bacillus sp. OG2]